jgi:hypothetical protein
MEPKWNLLLENGIVVSEVLPISPVSKVLSDIKPVRLKCAELITI